MKMTPLDASRPSRCESCGSKLRQPSGRGRPRRFCRPACRQAAYEARLQAAALDAMPVEDRSDWHTPLWLRRWLFARWNITFDSCATEASALANLWAGPDRDDDLRNALSPDVDWSKLAGLGGVVYTCPPFLPTDKLQDFLAKCASTAQSGTSCVAVVPSAEGTDWFDESVTLTGAAWSTVVGRFPFAGPHAAGGTPRWSVAVIEWPAGVRPLDPNDDGAHRVRRTLGRIVAPRGRRPGDAVLTLHHGAATAQRSACAPRETGLTVSVELDAAQRALGLAEFTGDELDGRERLHPGDRLLLMDRDRCLHPAVIEAITPGASSSRYRARFPR